MSKTVKLDDESAVLYLEGSDGTMEVDDNDTGSKCSCGCGCTERYWSIASSFCRMCQQGACDCTESAIAARIAGGACPECTEYDCECPEDEGDACYVCVHCERVEVEEYGYCKQCQVAPLCVGCDKEMPGVYGSTMCKPCDEAEDARYGL